MEQARPDLQDRHLRYPHRVRPHLVRFHPTSKVGHQTQLEQGVAHQLCSLGTTLHLRCLVD